MEEIEDGEVNENSPKNSANDSEKTAGPPQSEQSECVQDRIEKKAGPEGMEQEQDSLQLEQGVVPSIQVPALPTGLPPGWKQHWSKSKQRPYYRFSSTGDTTWEMPTASGLHDEHEHVRGGEDAVMKELGVAQKSQAEVEGRVIARLEAAARQREENQEKADMEKRQFKIQQLESNVDAVMKKLDLPAYASSFQQTALKEQLKELQDKLADVRELIKQAQLRSAAADKEGERADNPDAAVRILSGAASKETERERMIRTGLITPFDGRAEMERSRIHANLHISACANTHGSVRSCSSSGNGPASSSRTQQFALPALKPPASTRSTNGAKLNGAKLDKSRERVAHKSTAGNSRQKRQRRHVVDDLDDGDPVAFQARLNEQARAKLAKKRLKEGKSLLSSDDEDLNLGAESPASRMTKGQKGRGDAHATDADRVRKRSQCQAGGGAAANVIEKNQKKNTKRESDSEQGDEDAEMRSKELRRDGEARNLSREDRKMMAIVRQIEEMEHKEKVDKAVTDDDSDWLPARGGSDEEDGEGDASRKDDDYSDDLVDDEESELESGQDDADNESALEDDGEVEEFDGGFQIPTCIYHKLFPYQRTGVKWMWELHCQEAGGIVGDEMGLGKTVQIVAFLAGLHRSGKLDGPVILLCPATIMRQWVREFQKWYPPLRVVLLHTSGSSLDTPEKLLKDLVRSGGVVVTTYEQMRRKAELLVRPRWSYAVLDEGHKIRNPDADITQAVKSLDTPHRLLLSGSPIQNKLVELWSLFDFIFPGRLGTLPVFQTHFEVPIAAGGFANASNFQVQTAYKCALELRELIDPYLLRRLKSDVALQLPDKQEQVLFCRLTKQQRSMYEFALRSPDVTRAMEGNCQVFGALTLLRKICNHPDLQHVKLVEKPASYGCPTKSTKMQLLAKILPLWQEQGHRVLLFSQTKQMLDILEKFIQELGMSYKRMDGDSNIKSRMSKIDEFNRNAKIFCFLLTTKVGGLGTNLTGANRVIIYDPDWNPSTDLQARERAWRIGQTRDVVIYRLLVSGTIEEKIYHRQIFKQFLTNKILKDPRQRRFFKTKDLMDLFTLGDDSVGTETGDLFCDVADEMLAEDQSDEESYFNAGPRVRAVSGGQGSGGQGSGGDARPLQPDADPSKSANGKKSKEDKGGAGAAANMVDGIRLEGVEVRNVKSRSEVTDNSASEKKAETDMLKKLLLSNCISSAISHDSIMENKSCTAGESVSRKEAEAIARKAAAALRQSAEERMADPVNVPTWTGRAGMGGAPAVVREDAARGASKMRFGNVKKSTVEVGSVVGSLDGPALALEADALPAKVQAVAAGAGGSVACEAAKERGFGGAATCGVNGVSLVNPANSQQLLSALREKGILDNAHSRSNDEREGDDESWALIMMQDLSTFLSHRHRPPMTSQILDNFKERVPHHKQELFRTCLKQIAEVEKRDNRPGVWWLRPAFSSAAKTQERRVMGGSAPRRNRVEPVQGGGGGHALGGGGQRIVQCQHQEIIVSGETARFVRGIGGIPMPRH